VTSVLTNKGVFFADIVVNNTDITYFYKNILPDKKRFNQLSRRERSSSALIFYWGIRHVSDLDVHNILFSKDYPAEFRGLFKEKRFADDLTVYIFISSKVVPEDAPQGCENWFVMVNAPENVGQNWPEETERARRIIMQKIENMRGFSVDERIVNEHVVGPVDIERRTSSVNGSLYGHSSNSALAAFLRHPNFSPKFKNLYFVGGSVHPGGGIPLCLASAKIVDGMIKPAKS
jgi:phytoene dehydrogenase-like protein